MPVFPLTLEATYLKQGFFNVKVDFDKYVRPTEGPVELVLCLAGREQTVQAKVNRTANTNGTARVMGGARLKEWFLSHCDQGELLDVEFTSPTQMRIQKAAARPR